MKDCNNIANLFRNFAFKSLSMAFISLLLVVVFILVTMAWGVSLWMRIDENYPFQDFPVRHVILKFFMIFIFFPALILMALVLIASLADKKNT
ncbi:MAG: hypothetical protein RLY35_1696 [Bacteroidota bacterium]